MEKNISILKRKPRRTPWNGHSTWSSLILVNWAGLFFVVLPGIEPGLFWSRVRRVANYTTGQFWGCKYIKMNHTTKKFIRIFWSLQDFVWKYLEILMFSHNNSYARLRLCVNRNYLDRLRLSDSGSRSQPIRIESTEAEPPPNEASAERKISCGAFTQ